MAQYKTVAGPISTTISSGKDFEDAIARQAEIINRECVGGWEFYGIYPMSVTKVAAGIKNRLANWAGMDLPDGNYNAMMLVFKKD